MLELKVRPDQVADETLLRQRAADQLRVTPAELRGFRIDRRSLDARGRHPFYRVRVEVSTDAPLPPQPVLSEKFRSVHDAPEVLIVGAGPCGYFAALECLMLGLKPRIFDRGKDVRERRRDLRAIQQLGEVNPHSNYCFGEGGAGTYSDGKLYTRSQKRGRIVDVLRLLVEHGANEDILIDAHPHIGSNKLPGIVANIRATIEQYGGEVHFGSHVTDLLIEDGRIRGIRVHDSEEHLGKAVVLATGHSARDVYYLLHRHRVALEAKPFALGVRIEHPQPTVDRAQYGRAERGEHLPAASYRLTTQVRNRGVFSFCMCPGGLVVPAATAPGELVVNGMSLSRRDSPFANSGTVVSVELEDLRPFAQHGVFAALEFQRSVEQAVFNYGDGSQRAPAQRLVDFVDGKVSADLPEGSYIPGMYAAPVHEMLPPGIYERLRQGVQDFGRKMRGYYSQEAKVIATESRTSSPLRIPRDATTRMHPGVAGLFPAGEGAGYAGGILSAAMDGRNVARSVAAFLA